MLHRVGFGLIVGQFHGVGFGGHGQIDHRMGQVYGTFRHANEMAGLVGRHRDLQPPGIRNAHVLAGEPDHPPGNVQGIFPGFQHPGQPVHRRIRVGIPHGFVEGGNQIVVFFPGFVIEQGLFPGALLDQFPGNMDSVRFPFPVEHHHFQGSQSGPGISVGQLGQELQIFFFQMDPFIPEPPGILQGPQQDPFDVLLGQGLQHKHLAAAQERPVHFKGGIFRSGSDQDDGPFFHKGQEGILLGPVEPVDFVHEYNGPGPEPPVVIGPLHHRADILDAAGHCGKVDEIGFCGMGDDLGQGGLPHPRRPPKDHGGDFVLFNQVPEDFPRPQKMLLPHEFVQVPGPQPGRQRLLRRSRKKTVLFHGIHLPCTLNFIIP